MVSLFLLLFLFYHLQYYCYSFQLHVPYIQSAASFQRPLFSGLVKFTGILRSHEIPQRTSSFASKFRQPSKIGLSAESDNNGLLPLSLSTSKYNKTSYSTNFKRPTKDRSDQRAGKSTTHNQQGKKKSAQQRITRNKRVALRGVIRGVERLLAENEPEHNATNDCKRSMEPRTFSYGRHIDASLVDALYLLVNARSQKDVLDAEKRIKVLMGIYKSQSNTRVSTGAGSVVESEKRKTNTKANNQNPFEKEVTERVIKATAMAGLTSLSVDLLRSLLRPECKAFPSAIAYTAVLTALRKSGRIDRLEEVLTHLANADRRLEIIHPIEASCPKSLNTNHEPSPTEIGIDIVAFNTYLAALCDAAVNQTPFRSSISSFSDAVNTKENIKAGASESDFNMSFLNFSDPVNSTDRTLSLITQVSRTTSPSEKYLYKAFNLLKHDTARTRFSLAHDPDLRSYNTVLAAAAKCAKINKTGTRKFSRSIIEACLRIMDERQIRGDVFTYNARIQAVLASVSSAGSERQDAGGQENNGSELETISAEEEAVLLVDQLLLDPTVEPDRYTINLALIPFLHAGRQDEIWSMLERFFKSNVLSQNNQLVSSAFEAFLITLVQGGQIDFAREVFDTFFLSFHTKKNSWLTKSSRGKRMQILRGINVMIKESSQTIAAQQRFEKTIQNTAFTPVRLVSLSGATPVSDYPCPTTRHFNVLLGGYSKVYQKLVSRRRKMKTVATSAEGTSNIYSEQGKLGRDGPIGNLTNIMTEKMPTEEAFITAKKAHELLEVMLDIGIPLDGFSVSSLMAFPSTSDGITSLWKRIEPEISVELNPAAYRAIISAYGNVGDASSACWIFDEMGRVCGIRGRNIECWNVILGALAHGSCRTDGEISLNVINSAAARHSQDYQLEDKQENHTNHHLSVKTNSSEAQDFISLVDSKICLDASLCILDMMQNETLIRQGSKFLRLPKPNSQTYCLVASALARSQTAETSESDSKIALGLFYDALDQGVAADGRFLNAVLRCFGNDINSALSAWKGGIGAAAATLDTSANRAKKVSNNKLSNYKQGANLAAAYHGLIFVCGRAIRPDIALRVVYAMKKAGIEPTETSLNCYFSGKREAGNGSNFQSKPGLTKQYESLLSVECTKYNTKDRRRLGEKTIRIIL